MTHGPYATRQERSRETLERILVAAEALLETREFDALTMADLAEHAGCAIGTLYGRLPNKQSLLLCLHERYLAAGMSGFADVFAACADAGLEERVEKLCSLLVDFFSMHCGVTRAITNYLFARTGEDLGDAVRAIRRDSTAGFRQAAAFLAERVDRRAHDDPQAACEFGLMAAIDVIESRVVFVDRSRVRTSYSKRELKQRVATLLLAYLEGPSR